MKRTLAASAAALIIIMAGTLSMYTYYRSGMELIGRSVGSTETYDRHYLFISDDSSELWQSVYESARAAANASGAALEWTGQDSPIPYTLEQCMDIGISSGVDGILLCPDGTEEIRRMVDDAAGAGIPVVSLLRDASESRRVSFVGASNYQMGEMYGEQVLNLMKDGDNRVCLLLDSAVEKNASSLLYSQIVSTVHSGEPAGSRMELFTREADSRNDFEAEEVIRQLLVESRVPDILICTNSVQTECAVTALVDLNMVDDVQVIGYYASANILSSLRRDLLPVTVTCDAKQVGDLSVAVLNEYLDTGRVSDYFDISLEAVTVENVNRYVRGQHLAYSGGEGG